VIYPLVFKESIEHSEFGIMYSNSVRNFSTNRINFEFVGDSFDENDVRHPEYWKFIK
jgi:hypothetical protein